MANYLDGTPRSLVDIAVCDITPLSSFLENTRSFQMYLPCLSQSIMATDAQLSELSAMAEEVTFIGYPNGMWDTVNHLPIVRRGYTATPLQIDFEAKPQFLIDAAVFPGSSGSPVLLFNQGHFSTKRVGVNIGNRLYFLGVISAVYQQKMTGDVVRFAVPTRRLVPQIDVPINLGVVIKSRTVVETIEAFIRKQSGDPFWVGSI